MSRTRKGMRFSKPSKSLCASMSTSSSGLVVMAGGRGVLIKTGGEDFVHPALVRSCPRYGRRDPSTPLRAGCRRYQLDQTLVQHGIGYFQEAADVGAVDQVAGRAVLVGGPVAVVVDRDHDLVQTIVDLGSSPAEPGAVLRHLEA